MAKHSEDIEKKILGPLVFCKPDDETEGNIYEKLFPTRAEVFCLFCDKTFNFQSEKPHYLTHLYLEHRLIIGDEEQVSIFHEYLRHWREKFINQDFKTFCTKITMNQLPDGTPSTNEVYYLLCDISSEDNQLRQDLSDKRLKMVLEQFKLERIDSNYEKNCLFCRDVVKGTRAFYIEHLFGKHFLQLGKPENLVFIDELISTVQQKLDSLICLFCEKQFKDRSTLKEHMRKKGHKRINPNNRGYDHFFLVFYQKDYQIKLTKKTKSDEKYAKKFQTSEKTEEEECDSDSNWSDWGEKDELTVTCLFCSHKELNFDLVLTHMKIKHKIDFEEQTRSMSFYDRVKMVNYVRRKVFLRECLTCDANFHTSTELEIHLEQCNHFSLGQSHDWNKPEFYFPFFEDDSFLCLLHDENESADLSVIFSEDQEVNVNLDVEALFREQFSIK